jgi:hypothetical protein
MKTYVLQPLPKTMEAKDNQDHKFFNGIHDLIFNGKKASLEERFLELEA